MKPTTKPTHSQYVVVLPPYPLPRHSHRSTCQPNTSTCITFITLTIILLSTTYVLFPSDPHLSITKLKLDHLTFHTHPISLSIKLDLTIAVRNLDFYSIDYDSLRVGVYYRGNRLGNVSSEGGRVEARGVSYVEASLDLDGVEVLSDVFLLVEDLVKGVMRFDTVTDLEGEIGVFGFDVPVKAKIACEVIVNTRNQTISRQNCYPQLSQPLQDAVSESISPIGQLTQTM